NPQPRGAAPGQASGRDIVRAGGLADSAARSVLCRLASSRALNLEGQLRRRASRRTTRYPAAEGTSGRVSVSRPALVAYELQARPGDLPRSCVFAGAHSPGLDPGRRQLRRTRAAVRRVGSREEEMTANRESQTS